MMRRVRLCAWVVALLAALPGGAVAAEPAGGSAAPAGDGTTDVRVAHVTYLTSRTAYIDAGSDDGIVQGLRIEVVRSDSVVAVLRAEYVSATRASCAIETTGAELVIGDTVRFHPSAKAAPPAAPGTSTPEVSREPGSAVREAHRLGLRGRIGVRYLYLKDNAPEGGKITQPALDLRLDGSRVGGSGFDLAVDVRARQTYRTMAGQQLGSENTTSVYRLATAYQAQGSPWRLSAGRQLSPSLASVSIFDGVEGEYRTSRWSLGAFSGTQPDPVTLGYSSAVREHGGYAEWRNAPEARRRWTLTTGVVGSYEDGDISREFSYLQGSYYGPRLGLWVAQEVDVNRGWKTQYESQTLSPTSTFVSVRYKVIDALSLNAGYDNRRNVRLYRDRVTPETEFDDQYRNGVWGGFDLRMAGHFRAGAEVKTRGGGTLGAADSTTVTLGVDRLTRAGIFVDTRSTRYTSDQVEGWLHSVGLGLSLGSRWHAEITGGVRDETSRVDPLLDDKVTWYGLETDLSLGRGWFVSTSAETSTGKNEQLDQVYTSVSWRF